MRASGGPAATVLILLVALGGCGGSSASGRVRDYIDQANAIQRQAAPQMQAANTAYAQFAQGKLAPGAAVVQLQRAEEAPRSTRARLAALAVPPQARALRSRLLAVFDANVALAREATAMARYVPAASAQGRRVATAGRRLRADLRRAGSASTQARALARYGHALGTAEARLRALAPPPVLVPTHRAQLLRLLQARTVAGRLRTALRRRDARAVARLLVDFRDASRPMKGQAAVARAAVRAYDRRRTAIFTAVAAVRREQARLQRDLS